MIFGNVMLKAKIVKSRPERQNKRLYQQYRSAAVIQPLIKHENGSNTKMAAPNGPCAAAGMQEANATDVVQYEPMCPI